MDSRKKVNVKHSSTTKNCVSSGSSDYSTCSDSVNANFQISTQSAILAGQKISYDQVSDSILDDTNCTVNLLDQNIYVLPDDSEIFEDCHEKSHSYSCKDDSTIYNLLPRNTLQRNSANNDMCIVDDIGTSSNGLNVESLEIEKLRSERLVTILEEKEVTQTNSFLVRDLSLNNHNTTGKLLVEAISQIKDAEKDHCNRNLSKRVLFANEENILNDGIQNRQTEKSRFKKTPQHLMKKISYSAQKDENCNNHNTTESFVLWEKFCEKSEKTTLRRSFSFSELNSMSENYGGDDECSTSFKTLDNTIISNISLDSVHDKTSFQKKCSMRRSKSCDSLLKEVKHLPHLLYDRFLKCLSKEIENIRKQNIICTCEKSSRKKSNKENHKKKQKPTSVKMTNNSVAKKDETTDSRGKLRVSPLSVKNNHTRISPDSLKISPTNRTSTLSVSSLTIVTNQQLGLSPNVLKNSPENIQRASPKTPTTPLRKRGLYSWHKEIVSPVGEYIRGKRQSPFQSSPNKKKI